MENRTKTVAVYCASRTGAKDIYMEQAFALGQALAKAGWRIVYGGSISGLMGAMANGALESGGHVIGVYPPFIEDKEILHPNLTELYPVASMAERKTLMEKLSIGSISLPGGSGTMDEFFEVITNKAIGAGDHQFSILHNVDGFYDPLQLFFTKMKDEGFLSSQTINMWHCERNIQALIARMESFIN
ncbi:TIGR00730 family Rossman fold protein [Persicobacter psychrovividus]|uniref:Cytokinin riboside 5'-monophosphate phosphoribohydrolase n=1 Tax=Persicobacter psychrovividus TaxID=387638 RepID=A0ABN6LF11_9BACT|nr:cytokinin riboside 5'-monophosphate phosphoribohydrolase [Persicobacter psychrovividus]